jgi:hypothetical protein
MTPSTSIVLNLAGWVYRAAPQSVAAKSYTPTAELHWKLKQTSISQFLLKIDFCLC